jgi:hypothetical protein
LIRHRTGILFIGLIVLALCLVAGCSGPSRTGDAEPATPTTAPTPAPTVAPSASPTLPVPTATPASKECGAGPCLATTPTAVVPTAVLPTAPGFDVAFAALVDPEPGPTTLTYGSDVQNGAHGYAAWCAAGGRTTIYDTFGRVSIPSTALVVQQGGVVTFAYLGADPLREILARLYPATPVGTPPPPGQFTVPRSDTGSDLPVTQRDRVGMIAISSPPGEYVLFVNVRVQGGATVIGCGAQYQFRIRVT